MFFRFGRSCSIAVVGCWCRKSREAWELYLKMESNTDSFAMLVLIANDCYKV